MSQDENIGDKITLPQIEPKAVGDNITRETNIADHPPSYPFTFLQSDASNPTGRDARVVGMFYGAVIGSAIGAQYAYNKQADRCAPIEWGPHADIMLAVMNARMHNADPDDFIYAWLRDGFPEIESKAKPTLPAKIVWAHPDFHNGIAAHDTAARAIYEKSGGRFASMCPLVKMPAIAIDIEPDVDHIVRMCTTTHVDPRVIAVSKIFCLYLSAELSGAGHRFSEICSDVLGSMSTENTEPAIAGVSNIEPTSANALTFADEIRTAIAIGDLGICAKLTLDQMGKESHISKAAALISYLHRVISYADSQGRKPDFEKIIYSIAQQHGHAEANCTIAGAVLGAAGVTIPLIWQVDDDMGPLYDWLQRVIMAFIPHRHLPPRPNQ